MMYISDYDEVFMDTTLGADPWVFWPHQLQPYIKNWQVYTCPSNPYGRQVLNYHGMRYDPWPNYAFTNPLFRDGMMLAEIPAPAEKFMCFDSNHPVLGDIRGALTSMKCAEWSCNSMVRDTHEWLVPHNGRVNIGYCDGHTKWLSGDAMWAAYRNGAMNPTAK